jgi:hypothetical protein
MKSSYKSLSTIIKISPIAALLLTTTLNLNAIEKQINTQPYKNKDSLIINNNEVSSYQTNTINVIKVNYVPNTPMQLTFLNDYNIINQPEMYEVFLENTKRGTDYLIKYINKCSLNKTDLTCNTDEPFYLVLEKEEKLLVLEMNPKYESNASFSTENILNVDKIMNNQDKLRLQNRLTYNELDNKYNKSLDSLIEKDKNITSLNTNITNLNSNIKDLNNKIKLISSNFKYFMKKEYNIDNYNVETILDNSDKEKKDKDYTKYITEKNLETKEFLTNMLKDEISENSFNNKTKEVYSILLIIKNKNYNKWIYNTFIKLKKEKPELFYNSAYYKQGKLNRLVIGIESLENIKIIEKELRKNKLFNFTKIHPTYKLKNSYIETHFDLKDKNINNNEINSLSKSLVVIEKLKKEIQKLNGENIQKNKEIKSLKIKRDRIINTPPKRILEQQEETIKEKKEEFNPFEDNEKEAVKSFKETLKPSSTTNNSEDKKKTDIIDINNNFKLETNNN